MPTVRTARRLVTVTAVAASMVGIGGLSTSAFADTTGATSGGSIVTTNPCPSGWLGTEVGVDGHTVFACTNLIP